MSSSPKGGATNQEPLFDDLIFKRKNLHKLPRQFIMVTRRIFLLALAQSVSNQPKSSSMEHENIQEWDGSLSPDDILTLAKQAHNPRKKMTVFETIITESAPQHFHLSASDVLDIQDTTSATEIVRALGRKLPGFMDSERKVNAMKAKFVREFEVIWQPKRTHSGWQVNPECLRETLLYLYWWLPENEWWKIYGDGRNFGGKDSVALTLNVLNDEALFNNISFPQSRGLLANLHFLWKGHKTQS